MSIYARILSTINTTRLSYSFSTCLFVASLSVSSNKKPVAADRQWGEGGGGGNANTAAASAARLAGRFKTLPVRSACLCPCARCWGNGGDGRRTGVDQLTTADDHRGRHGTEISLIFSSHSFCFLFAGGVAGLSDVVDRSRETPRCSIASAWSIYHCAHVFVGFVRSISR